jgi:hypothetical protein
MILLTDEQQLAILAALSETAIKRLIKQGIDLRTSTQAALTALDVIGIDEGSIIGDADGHIWLAVSPIPGETALCPFDERQAFSVIADNDAPGGYRTWAARDGSDGAEAVIPAFPLRLIGQEPKR